MLSKSQVKYIQSLGRKKCRDEEGLFLAEGPKIIAELLKEKKCVIVGLYAVKEWMDENGSDLKTQAIEISIEELERISQFKTPNKVLLVAKKMEWEGEPKIKNEITLALDCIQDPGNLGTIIRLADWFGVHQIICSPECADIYNPKTVQASMASIARVRIDHSDISEFLKKNDAVNSYAAVLEGEDVSKMEMISEGIIVIGNESQGISEEILSKINTRITIPGKGKAESLNAAIATGIILSHLTL